MLLGKYYQTHVSAKSFLANNGNLSPIQAKDKDTGLKTLRSFIPRFECPSELEDFCSVSIEGGVLSAAGLQAKASIVFVSISELSKKGFHVVNSVISSSDDSVQSDYSLVPIKNSLFLQAE